MMYKYCGFGLNIAAEIEIPELLSADFDKPDIEIVLGNTPGTLQGELLINRRFFSLTLNEYILKVKNVCYYYAGFGNTIIVQPEPDADERSVRLFLLGSVMAALLYQRGSIPLHASAIIKEGKLVLFTGNSGAGKSTLAAHLQKKGYQVFTDDICVLLSQNDNNIYGVASYPMIKLWEDAIHKLGSDDFTKDFKIRPHLPKYGQFFHDDFVKDALPVSKLFVLHTKNDSPAINCRRMKGVDAFKLVEKQAYKQRLATGDKLRPLYFLLMTKLTHTIPVFETTRPVSGTTIDSFSDMIEQHL